MRLCYTLSGDDSIAALQVLAHLSYPARVDFALGILAQWNRHLSNTDPTEKRSRIEPKVRRLDDMVRRRLKGSYWLRLQQNQALNRLDPEGADGSPAAGLRACARVFRESPDASETNVIETYWAQTRSVAHLGLATLDAIGPQFDLWNLDLIAFRSSWVSEALAAAEQIAVQADMLGIIPISDAILFSRDIFSGQ